MKNLVLKALSFVLVLAAAGGGFYLGQRDTARFGAISLPDAPYGFQTTLQSGIGSTDTSMTLSNGQLRDGTTITGFQCFTIDAATAQAEYVCGTASGTAISALLRGVTPLNPSATSSALAFSHRRGADVRISDFPILQYLKRLLAGTDAFPSKLTYDSTVSTSTLAADPNALVNVSLLNSTAIAGAPNASTTLNGLSEEATNAEIDSGALTGSTGAPLFVNPNFFASSTLGQSIPSSGQKLALAGNNGTPGASNTYLTQTGFQRGQEIYGESTATTSNTFALTLTPALASYATGTVINFKAATTTTGAATLNVSALGAKTIKRLDSTDLVADDIKSGTLLTVIYNGTNFILRSLYDVQVIDRSNTSVNVSSTTVETTIYSKSVDPGVMGSSTGFRLNVVGDLTNQTGSGQTGRLKVKFGSTTLVDTGTFTITSAGGNAAGFEISVYCTNNGTGAQRWGGHLFVGATDGAAQAQGAGRTYLTGASESSEDVVLGILNKTSAEDTTSAKTLSVTLQFGAESTNLFGAKRMAILERY